MDHRSCAGDDGATRLQANGRQYEIPLPDGYCDISTSPAGIALKGFLDNLAQTNIWHRQII